MIFNALLTARLFLIHLGQSAQFLNAQIANNIDTLKHFVTGFQNASNAQETINLRIVEEKLGQMM